MRTCLEPVEKKGVRQVKEKCHTQHGIQFSVLYTVIFIYGKRQRQERVVPSRLKQLRPI